MPIRISNRSHVNRNNMRDYSEVDCKLDHPHLPERDARRIWMASRDLNTLAGVPLSEPRRLAERDRYVPIRSRCRGNAAVVGARQRLAERQSEAVA